MISMEDIRLTMKIELPEGFAVGFARQAAEELGVMDKIGVDLDPDLARALADLIYDRARVLERDAAIAAEEERRRQELEEHGT